MLTPFAACRYHVLPLPSCLLRPHSCQLRHRSLAILLLLLVATTVAGTLGTSPPPLLPPQRARALLATSSSRFVGAEDTASAPLPTPCLASAAPRQASGRAVTCASFWSEQGCPWSRSERRGGALVRHHGRRGVTRRSGAGGAPDVSPRSGLPRPPSHGGLLTQRAPRPDHGRCVFKMSSDEGARSMPAPATTSSPRRGSEVVAQW
jgi:hypothetical protein